MLGSVSSSAPGLLWEGKSVVKKVPTDYLHTPLQPANPPPVHFIVFINEWKGSPVALNPKPSFHLSTIPFSLPAPKNVKTFLLLRRCGVTHQHWQSVLRGCPRRPCVRRVIHPRGTELGEQQDSEVEPAPGGSLAMCAVPGSAGPVLGVPWR